MQKLNPNPRWKEHVGCRPGIVRHIDQRDFLSVINLSQFKWTGPLRRTLPGFFAPYESLDVNGDFNIQFFEGYGCLVHYSLLRERGPHQPHLNDEKQNSYNILTPPLWSPPLRDGSLIHIVGEVLFQFAIKFHPFDPGSPARYKVLNLVAAVTDVPIPYATAEVKMLLGFGNTDENGIPSDYIYRTKKPGTDGEWVDLYLHGAAGKL